MGRCEGVPVGCGGRKESGWRLMGRLYAPVPGLPRPGTFGACAPCTALSHNRVRPLWRAVRNTERNAPCLRELTGENSPHLYRGGKMEKPHQQNATFLV